MELIKTGRKTHEDLVEVPWHQFPIWRAQKAKQLGTGNRFLVLVWGGIGDVICAIPTVQYMLANFRDCMITVATDVPEVFEHLRVWPNLEEIYDVKKVLPIEEDYLVFQTIPIQGRNSLAEQFFSHMHMQCVDFPAISALRCQLPIADREVKIDVPVPKRFGLTELDFSKHIPVHAGRHWESKTFPVVWWNAVLDEIKAHGFTPVLIGKDGGESQGYVDCDPEGCLDLRDKTTILETIWLLQNSHVVVCNDSSPLHMAVTGNAWIGFIASVKRPEFIMHYRNGMGFGWRQENLGLDGLWNYSSINPNTTVDINLDKLSDPTIIEKILPHPTVIGKWCKEKMYDYARGI